MTVLFRLRVRWLRFQMPRVPTFFCIAPILPAFLLLIFWPVFVPAADAQAQRRADRASRNIDVRAQLPLGGQDALRAVYLDQHPERALAYAAGPGAWHVVDVADETQPRAVHTERTSGQTWLAIDGFRHSGSSLLVLGGSGLEVWNVTDPASPKLVVRLDAALSGDARVQNVFAYRSGSRANWLFVAAGGDILVYDIDAALTGSPEPYARIGLPEPVPNVDYGFHDAWAAFHADTETDRLYASGAGGYYIFDITDMRQPRLVTEVNSAAVQVGRSIRATPDGTHLVTTAGYETAPIRIFDMRPALDGTVPVMRTAVGAWTANWRRPVERHVVRWPFIFVAAFEEGLQVVNMMDPVAPYTDAFFRTWQGPVPAPGQEPVGARDVDVRNRDGLIAIADQNEGLFLFRIEAFHGWDGRGWGLPNVSDVQDWESGPMENLSW